MHCGIMDRSGVLDQGFDYHIIDPIPTPVPDEQTFEILCDRRGNEIVQDALNTNRNIRVLWSGGIDSTTGLIALMKTHRQQNLPPELIKVSLSEQSIAEYPRFFERDIVPSGHPISIIDGPVAKLLKPNEINVTGEHGDQIFGSMILEPYVRAGQALDNYQDALPQVIFDVLQNQQKTDRVIQYLLPQLREAPIGIHTLFDALWWFNFSLKWQHVTLRLAALSDHPGMIYSSLNHFFRPNYFQNYSLTHPEIRHIEDWKRYKNEAKRYILDYTDDEEYYTNKIKQPSLKGVLFNGQKRRISMRSDFIPEITQI